MSSRRIGYVRINPHREGPQQLKGQTLDKVYTDYADARGDRPQREDMLADLQRGDTLVVESMSVLSPNPWDLHELFAGLIKRGVVMEFVGDWVTLDPSKEDEIDKLTDMFAAVMEFLTNTTDEEVKDRFARAKERGTTKRQKALSDEQIAELRAKHKRGHSKASLAKEYGVSRMTIDRYLSEEQQ